MKELLLFSICIYKYKYIPASVSNNCDIFAVIKKLENGLKMIRLYEK